MTIINIGTIHALPNRWIALALERKSSALVACTSSEQSATDAKKNLRNTILRLNRFNEVEEVQQFPETSQIGSRLAKLLQGNGLPFSIGEISKKGWSSARLRISKQLLQVPRGKVISYKGLAEQSNSSPRGVGSVMRSNPVPWAIPCHRVIHSDGSLGKFGGTISGTREKARILRAEGVLFNNDETVNQRVIIS